jgi:hypothetical protein
VSELVSPDHPIRELIFFAAGLTEADKAKIADFVNRLAATRNWVIGPPFAVDLSEEDESDPDSRIDAFGGVLELYSALPPWKVPREIDVLQFEEVVVLMQALEAYSLEHHLEFEVYLGDEGIGAIENGRCDRSLREGLIDEWRKVLGI